MRNALSAQSRQALRASIPRKNSQLYFRLAKPCRLARKPDRTAKRQFAATAECEAIDRANRRPPDGFEQMKYPLAKERKLLPVNGSLLSQLVDVGAGYKRLFTRTSQNQHAHRAVVAGIRQNGVKLL